MQMTPETFLLKRQVLPKDCGGDLLEYGMVLHSCSPFDQISFTEKTEYEMETRIGPLCVVSTSPTTR